MFGKQMFARPPRDSGTQKGIQRGLPETDHTYPKLCSYFLVLALFLD